jgi:LysM repeat protein
MTPVILDQGRYDLRIPALRADRALGQVVLVGLLGIALVVILVTRPSTDPNVSGPIGAVTSVVPSNGSAEPSAAAASSSPVVASQAPASPEPSTASAPPASSAAGSPSPTAQATTSGETYRIKRGDTLIAIAGRYGTTVKVLMDLNNIDDPSKLRIGQILELP